MSNPTFQLVAVNHKNTRVQILAEDRDISFLDKIVEARDGITWVGSEPCSLEVVRV